MISNEELQAYFCRQIITAREEKPYTRAEAARLLGISQDKLSRIEKGKTRLKALMAFKMAVIYEKPVDFFCSE